MSNLSDTDLAVARQIHMDALSAAEAWGQEMVLVAKVWPEEKIWDEVGAWALTYLANRTTARDSWWRGATTENATLVAAEGVGARLIALRQAWAVAVEVTRKAEAEARYTARRKFEEERRARRRARKPLRGRALRNHRYGCAIRAATERNRLDHSAKGEG